MSVSLWGAGWADCLVCPGRHRLRPRRGAPPFVPWGCWCWLCGCCQGGEPLPAVEEGACPGPAAADGEGALAGVEGEPGREVPDPVAESTGVCVAELGVVAVAEEAGPGGEVSGDVRRDDPAAVDLPGLGGKGAQSHGLGGAHSGGLDAGVLAVQDVDELRVMAAGDAADPAAGDAGAGHGVAPSGLLLVIGQVAHLPARRLHPAHDPAQAVRPVLRPGQQARDLRDVLVLLGAAVLAVPGLPRAGRNQADGVLV